jgi:hypothetical protein
MAIPTVEECIDDAQALLGDPSGVKFTDASCLFAFGRAYRELFAEMLSLEIPRIKNIATANLTAGLTSLTPSAAGISDFGELIEVEERMQGSTDDFMPVEIVGKLQQGLPFDVIAEVVWRLDALYFLGATTNRELRITYYSSGAAPTSGSVGVDDSRNYFGARIASIVGPPKGHLVDARELRAEADMYLRALVDPMLKNNQTVKVQQSAFRVGEDRTYAARFRVVAGASSGGTVPNVYSTGAGTITGTLNGTNDTFYIGQSSNQVAVYLNGARLTSNAHYTHGGNVITFISPYIPQVGADILVEAW